MHDVEFMSALSLVSLLRSFSIKALMKFYKPSCKIARFVKLINHWKIFYGI